MDRIERIRDFLKENPTDSFLQHALALEYLKLGDKDQARKIFEGILGQDPDYVGSYYHLAKLLEGMGEIDLSIAWYEKGMETAKKIGDMHSYGELKSAYEELKF